MRNDLKRRRRRAAEHGVVVEVGALSTLDLSLKKIHSLLIGPFDRHEVPRLYSTDALGEILNLPFTRLLIAKVEGRTQGAFVMFLHETTLYVWAGGIDYEWLREYSTYAVLIYETLAFAHLTGVRSIEFGRANLGFKSCRNSANIDTVGAPNPPAEAPTTGYERGGEMIEAMSRVAANGVSIRSAATVS